MTQPILAGVLTGAVAVARIATAIGGDPAHAGPVLCKTTLEAPAGSTVENTALSLLEHQNLAMPLRTADLPSCLGSGLAGTACGATPVRAEPYEPGIGYDRGESVRGLW